MFTIQLFPDPTVLIQLGPLMIRYYALAYIFGLVLGWQMLRVLVRREPLVATTLQADDFLTWSTLGVVLGGRRVHLVLALHAGEVEHVGAGVQHHRNIGPQDCGDSRIIVGGSGEARATRPRVDPRLVGGVSSIDHDIRAALDNDRGHTIGAIKKSDHAYIDMPCAQHSQQPSSGIVRRPGRYPCHTARVLVVRHMGLRNVTHEIPGLHDPCVGLIHT